MSSSFDGGEFTEAETMRGRAWPCLRQFCVFLENRVGRLNDLMRQVESLDTRVLALSIVDSVDFAIVRLIFNNSDRARETLELSGFVFNESDVVGVALPEGEKPFHDLCSTLMTAEVNIHHVYPLLLRARGHRAVAIYVDDVDTAIKILKSGQHRIFTETDLQDDDEFL